MQRLSELVRRYCAERDFRFKPWEIPPWDCELDEPCPFPSNTAGASSWPKAIELRRRILAELGELK